MKWLARAHGAGRIAIARLTQGGRLTQMQAGPHCLDSLLTHYGSEFCLDIVGLLAFTRTLIA